MVEVRRFDVCLVNLDPTLGSEIQKTRPCLIISPDSMNLSRLKTLIIAPLTSTIRTNFPTRIAVEFQNKQSQIALDQIRVVDRLRIVRVLGLISHQEVKTKVLQTLQVMFAN